VEDIERATKYFSLINVFGHWVDSFVPLNPRFVRTDYFSEEECLLIKQMYIMNCSVQPPINFSQVAGNIQKKVFNLVRRVNEPINDPAIAAAWNQGGNNPQEKMTYKSLAESFDRVLESEQFTETIYSYLNAGGDMMGMGMYGGMPNMMPGQMFGQFPQMVQTMPQADVQANIPQQIQPNIGTYNQIPAQNIQQEVAQTVEPTNSAPAKETAPEENTPYQSISVEETTEQPPIEAPVSTGVVADSKHIDDVWRDDGDDEDEDDDDSDHIEKSPQEDVKEKIHPEETEAHGLSEKEKEFYIDKPYNTRGRGRGRGRHTTRGYQTRPYRGNYDNNYRGGRGGYNKDYHNQGHESNYRGGRRGGNTYRHDRGGRDAYYQQKQYYNEENQYYEEENYKHSEKPVEKVDDDGFNVVTEKVYTKKKFNKRGGTYRGKPKAS